MDPQNNPQSNNPLAGVFGADNTSVPTTPPVDSPVNPAPIPDFQTQESYAEPVQGSNPVVSDQALAMNPVPGAIDPVKPTDTGIYSNYSPNIRNDNATYQKPGSNLNPDSINENTVSPSILNQTPDVAPVEGLSFDTPATPPEPLTDVAAQVPSVGSVPEVNTPSSIDLPIEEQAAAASNEIYGAINDNVTSEPTSVEGMEDTSVDQKSISEMPDPMSPPQLPSYEEEVDSPSAMPAETYNDNSVLDEMDQKYENPENFQMYSNPGEVIPQNHSTDIGDGGASIGDLVSDINEPNMVADSQYEAGPEAAGAISPLPSKSGGLKKGIMLAAGIFLILSALGIFAYVLISSLGGGSSTPVAEVTPVPTELETATPTESASPTQTPLTAIKRGVLPDGIVDSERYCFNFIVRSDNKLTADNDCRFETVYGNAQTEYFGAEPLSGDLNSLADAVNLWKSQNRTQSVVSEKETRVDGQDAIEIIHKASTSDNSLQEITILVLSPKKYLYRNDIYSAFKIYGSYEDDFSKSNYNQLITEWLWK